MLDNLTLGQLLMLSLAVYFAISFIKMVAPKKQKSNCEHREPVATMEIKASPDSNMIEAMALMTRVEGMKAANARFYSLGDGSCYREEEFILMAQEIEALLEGVQ